ncbi:MAG: hypothetical protein ACPG7F_09695 [Aggregatilineales bacterium]
MSSPHLRSNRHTPLSILRSFIVICISMLLCSMAGAFTLQHECLNTFYERLPVYPDADMQLDRGHFLNHLGIGAAGFQYYVDEEPQTVHLWYQRLLASRRTEQRSADNPPRAWQGVIDIQAIPDDPGTMIYLTAVCRVARVEGGDVSIP